VKVEIEVGEYADNVAVMQDIHRAVTLVLIAAEEADRKRVVPIGRGYDGNAVRASMELADKQKAAHEATFGKVQP
jgi:hypothetical protein